MPTPTRRLAAAATAALIALLTAAAVGLVSPQPTCRGTAAGTPVCAVAGFEPVPAVVALVGALAAGLAAALDVAGVRTVEPTGARFDPAHHEAGGAAPSTDPARVGTIAAVEVPGYLDRDGRALRVPVVTVFRTATTTDREER